jgi:hypothetical protein
MTTRACQLLGHNWTAWTYQPRHDTYRRRCTGCGDRQYRQPTYTARPLASHQNTRV